VNIRALGLAGATVAMGIGFAAPARAITVELDFTAVDFPPGSPNTSLTGRFTYQAASLTSPLTSLTSVDLTIDGHAYTLGEVGAVSGPDDQLIGTTIEGVGTVESGVNSFAFSYTLSTGSPNEQPFDYGAVSNPDIAETFTYSQFSVRSVSSMAAPEPATWSLLLIGFLGAGGLAVRRRLSRIAV
jgi:hypothetical protein